MSTSELAPSREELASLLKAVRKFLYMIDQFLPAGESSKLVEGGLGNLMLAARQLEAALDPMREKPGRGIVCHGWPLGTWAQIKHINDNFEKLLSRWGWRGVVGKRGREEDRPYGPPWISSEEIGAFSHALERLSPVKEEPAPSDDAPHADGPAAAFAGAGGSPASDTAAGGVPGRPEARPGNAGDGEPSVKRKYRRPGEARDILAAYLDSLTENSIWQTDTDIIDATDVGRSTFYKNTREGGPLEHKWKDYQRRIRGRGPVRSRDV